VTVTNSGSAPLRVSSIALTGDNSGDFAETNNCGSGVAAGASCTINVTFTPGAVGARAAAIQVTDTAPDSPQSITLSGTGLGAVATLSDSSLNYSQLLGTATTQTVTLSDTGNQALNITSVAISGSNSSDFTQTNNCGTSVAAGASCTISVTFTPSARGARSATLAVTDNASGSLQTVALSGTAISPVVSASPASLTFPSQFVGTTGLPQNVTVSNTGEVALTISSVQASADFGETSGCTSSLAPGVSCTIGVFFHPSASGSRSGTLTITGNAPGSPHTVALSGTGQDFTVSATSTTATITAGQTATYNLSLAPAGGLSQTVTLGCAGAPGLATCSVPAMVTLNGSSATAVAVTVSTTASTMTPPGGRSRWPSWPAGLRTGLPWPIMMLALMMVALMPWRSWSGGRALPRRRVALGTLTLLVTLWTACGGGGSSVVHSPGTPAGTYTLTVTATVTSNSATLKHSENLELTVQ